MPHNSIYSKAIIWYEEKNYQIKDLKSDRYEDALNFLEEYYIKNIIDFGYKFKKFENLKQEQHDEFNEIEKEINEIKKQLNEIKKEFREIFKVFFKDDVSLIVVDNETNEIIAVMVNIMMSEELQSWDLWTVFIDNPIVESIFEFEKLLVFESIKNIGLEKPNDSLHVFVLCLPYQHKGNNWKMKMLMTAAKLAKDLELPLLTYVAFTKSDHRRALKIGMKEVAKHKRGDFESNETVMNLKWLPKQFNEIFYHELDIDSLPEGEENVKKYVASVTQN